MLKNLFVSTHVVDRINIVRCSVKYLARTYTKYIIFIKSAKKTMGKYLNILDGFVPIVYTQIADDEGVYLPGTEEKYWTL